jgi:hypothetical protein
MVEFSTSKLNGQIIFKKSQCERKKQIYFITFAERRNDQLFYWSNVLENVMY